MIKIIINGGSKVNPIFEMVKYYRKKYPENIALHCEEIAAHFDVCKIEVKLPYYSLHTEYSYINRKFSSNLYNKDSELTRAQKGGVPQLWKNEQWAIEFAEFILKLTYGKPAPTVIEIHPPFSDYTDSLETFVTRYKIFEKFITELFPNVQILIENRCGTHYNEGQFVLSKLDSLISLSTIIDQEKLRLRFALDFPQLYTAHNCNNANAGKYYDLIKGLEPVKHNIECVHLWGKKKTSIKEE